MLLPNMIRNMQNNIRFFHALSSNIKYALIFLTSGIGTDICVHYGEVAQAHTRVFGKVPKVPEVKGQRFMT
jgi:hypothetical protein